MNDHCVYVDVDVTVLDGIVHDVPRSLRSTPVDAFAAGLGGLLTRLAPRYGNRPEGVLLLGAAAAKMLDMPGDPDGDRAAALIEELARAGWSCTRVSDWTTVYGADRPKIHVANLGIITGQRYMYGGKSAEFPLYAADPMDLVARLKMWHELTGYAWRLTPAAAGLAVMSGLDKERVKRGTRGGSRAVPTTWKPKEREPGPAEDDYDEHPYRRESWSRKPAASAGYVHAYDGIRAYMGAAMLTEVSPWALTHTGRQAFDKRRAGWWRVELAPWDVTEMPDPAGYVPLTHKDDPKRYIRTITTPTLTLLEELAAEGVYGGARVLDSWTGPARDYPLRPYASRMSDAYHLVRDVNRTGTLRKIDWEMLNSTDVEAVRSAVKMVGHKTFGALDDLGSWAHRPHMWYSILATWRANLWRRCWKVGKRTGQWPLWIETDAVWYGSECDDPWETARGLQFATPTGPWGFLLDGDGLQLGRFQPKHSKRLKARR